MPPISSTFDLFAQPKKEPPALSVTQLNQKARGLLERQFARVQVVGEVSNLKVVGGHTYFTLKDNQSQVAAVLFRREAMRQKYRLEPGTEVVATAKLSLYSPYGRYQLICEGVIPRGAGALHAAYEQLKANLEREGLFAADRKRPLPRVPGRVGVVTSPTGAVIRDIYHVSRRRFPNSDLLVFPTRVQGPESADGIFKAIQRATSEYERLGLEVLIVARGGGSLEDLWGFNDERVARAIVASPIPVVSAVGHETDFTIADFVADCRAPTPSAAAEVVFPVKRDLESGIAEWRFRAEQRLRDRVEREQQRIDFARHRMGEPETVIRDRLQALHWATARLGPALKDATAGERQRLANLERRLASHDPKVRLTSMRSSMGLFYGRMARGMQRQTERDRERLERLKQRLGTSMKRLLERDQATLNLAMRRLDALSPLKVLERGYAIALDEDGQAVRDAEEVEAGDTLTLRLAKGTRQVRVES